MKVSTIMGLPTVKIELEFTREEYESAVRVAAQGAGVSLEEFIRASVSSMCTPQGAELMIRTMSATAQAVTQATKGVAQA